jgi:hypothetical protein
MLLIKKTHQIKLSGLNLGLHIFQNCRDLQYHESYQCDILSHFTQ